MFVVISYMVAYKQKCLLYYHFIYTRCRLAFGRHQSCLLLNWICCPPLPRDQFCFHYWLCIQTTTIFHCELHLCLCTELVASPATMSSWISTYKSLWVMKDLKEVWIAQRGSDLLIENAPFFFLSLSPPKKWPFTSPAQTTLSTTVRNRYRYR